jgi:DNA polymerase-3 subunit delta'
MPFPANWIEQRLLHAQQENRLAHAYLLAGHNLGQLRALFSRLASQLLGSTAEGHPDLHTIQPESKSRRLTVEQIRNLEQQLQLKARQAKIKIAGIIAADRMCIGSAEAANAFLKTLEEPPGHTVIFLLTDRLEQLLPTIRSRCLTLQIETDDKAPSPAVPAWAKDWLNTKGTPADQAYRRAGLLSGHWKKLREQTETQNEGKKTNAEEALIEAEYLLARDNSIRTLITGAWNPADHLTATPIINGLEDLRHALSRNIEQNLALERICLKISGLIEDKS